MEEMSLEQGLEEIGHKILVLTRNELYMKMRFMDVALSAFYYVQDFSVDLLATDGETMYFNGQMLGGEYRQNRIGVNRAYLHLVLHCIFRHVFRRNGREELMWNLAADIAVESVIDDWNLQNIRKSQSWIRQRTYRDLKEEIKVFTAEKIYGVLVRWKLSNREMERMVREFTVDDHKYWAKDEDDDRKSEMNQRWQDISVRSARRWHPFRTPRSLSTTITCKNGFKVKREPPAGGSLQSVEKPGCALSGSRVSRQPEPCPMGAGFFRRIRLGQELKSLVESSGTS